ncbi:hypothetical protein ATPR_0814 [Acetobacter tropicalis NBRC 101654]|uniref:Uncharacterized protein n=1 Tax=Acetobacter tropicalis NBRC 101654 TaxID=749388 RepID=F7VBR5_9PROT|nr:hypothetical protein ATPR_0814 [Acetobacter tropicalis NBRC 101654]
MKPKPDMIVVKSCYRNQRNFGEYLKIANADWIKIIRARSDEYKKTTEETSRSRCR